MKTQRSLCRSFLLLAPVTTAWLLLGGCDLAGDPMLDDDLDVSASEDGQAIAGEGLDSIALTSEPNIENNAPPLHGECPGPYEGEPCRSLCTVGGLGTMVCDMSSGAFQGAQVWAATDLDGTIIPNYEVWGVDGQSREFCCHFDEVVREIDIIGTHYDDEISFDWASGTHVLAAHPNNGVGVYASVHGGLGDDEILGSPTSATSYEEQLYGEAGGDTIDGQAGDDEIYGGVGSDTVQGGAGNDLIMGGPGDDQLAGGYGSDEIFGESGNDGISGGPGDDEIFGGDGDDALCSGPDGLAGDLVWSGAGADAIWVPGTNATPNLGVSGMDTCGDATHVAAGPGCSWTLTSPPAACP